MGVVVGERVVCLVVDGGEVGKGLSCGLRVGVVRGFRMVVGSLSEIALFLGVCIVGDDE